MCRCGRERGASTGYDTRYIHRIRHTVYIPMCLDDRRTSTMKATWSAHVSKKSQKDLGTSHLRCSAHTSTSPPRVLVGRRYIVLGRRDGVCCRHGCRGHEAAAPARARAAVEPARWSTTHPAFIHVQHLFGVCQSIADRRPPHLPKSCVSPAPSVYFLHRNPACEFSSSVSNLSLLTCNDHVFVHEDQEGRDESHQRC